VGEGVRRWLWLEAISFTGVHDPSATESAPVL
jgi:hypothetical protein